MTSSPLLLSPLLLVAACASEPDCVSLRPLDGFENHVQVFDLAIDVERRRVYSSALGSRAVLVYDADSRQVVDQLILGEAPLTTPVLEVDLGGAVWVATDGSPALLRFDPDTQELRSYGDEIDGARAIARRADGGVVVLGRDEVSNNTLMAMDADGERVIRHDVEADATGVFPLDGGARVAVPLHEGELVIYDGSDLVELERCELSIVKATYGAQLDDGTVVVASEGAVGIAGCDGVAPLAYRDGVEIMEVISLGDHALVLDRIGSGEGVDPNLGLARSYDRSGLLGSFVTGKNTGFGALDPRTELLWLNSEGSSEVLVMEPDDGELVEAIRTGTFLDGLAIDLALPGVTFVTGRLSDTVVRLEGDAVTATTGEIRWPWSPTPDAERGLLWVLEHTDSRVHGLDWDDLNVVHSIDPGLGPNTLLTFGNLDLHPELGTLFLADSQRDLLLELDPDSGLELTRWELGGPLIDDPDEVGELAVKIHPDALVVYTGRSNDGRVQRLDPSTGELREASLEAGLLGELRAGHSTDFLELWTGADLLYVGGFAFDATTLERLDELDLDVTRMIGPHPTKAGHSIAIDDDERLILRIDEGGRVRGRVEFASIELHATAAKVDAADERVWMTQALYGQVCAFPVADLR